MANEKNEYRGKDNRVCEEATDEASPAPTTMRSNVPINVTPLFSQKSNEVICAIDAPAANQKGGMINLPRGGSYTLEFTLQPGTSPAPQNLRFEQNPSDSTGSDGTRAFWCDEYTCPTHSQMDCHYTNPRLSNGGMTLEVDVDPPKPTDPESAVHYRLNFQPKGHFDPIIIHD